MDQYVTGAIIKKLREKQKMTQQDLANVLCVSDKAISKWETGKCYPDVTLLEPLAKALNVSVIELMQGSEIVNANLNANVLRSKVYVCPVCGNVIVALGDALVTCHGIVLLPLEAEEVGEEHGVTVERVEDEFYVTIDCEMTKSHYVSFMLAVSDGGYQLVKTYPESLCEARFKANRVRLLYFYCNKHGLYKMKIDKNVR